MGEEQGFRVDFSNVPLRPTSKKEIKILETALIVATLYRPEVIELIRDPLEKATWLDSLAIAAAALAREKAGYTISQIAEELGRSETTIRAHLQGKTKAGRIVRETYEKLARGEIEIKVPFMTPLAEEKLKEEIEALRRENERLREELSKCKELEDVKAKLGELAKRLEEIEKENEELRRRANELEEKAKLVDEIKKLLGC